MTETIRYTPLAKEDVRLEPRDGHFEATLADGSIVTLSALDVAYLLSDAYNTSVIPSNLPVGLVFRLKDGIRGLWSIAQSGLRFGLNGEIANIKEFGGVGDGLADEVTAFNAAAAALASTGGVLYIPQGQWRFASAPNALTAGIVVQGGGAVSFTAGQGTMLIADYLEGTAANGLLTWNGSAGTGKGIGGGVRDLTIYKASGRSGGTAIKFTGTTDNLRSGVNIISRVVVTGGGKWDHGWLVDGTGLNTPLNAGIRGNFVNDLRIDNCNVVSKSIWLKNATEVMAKGVRVAQASGDNTSGITIDGASGSNASSTDVTFVDVVCEGNVVMDYASRVAIHGTVQGTISTSANSANCQYFGPVTSFEYVDHLAAQGAFVTSYGSLVDGPYMRSLTNRTGVALTQGAVVATDASNDTAVTLDDNSASLRPFVIAGQAIANGVLGAFATHGICVVNVTGAVTRGHYIRKSGTTLVAEDTGVAAAAATNPPTGALGIALTAAAGPSTGSIIALVFGGAPVGVASGAAGLTITSAQSDVLTSETTTSTSYANLATTGPAVTLSPGGTTTQIIAIMAAMLEGASFAECYSSVAIAGAAAADKDGCISSGSGSGDGQRYGVTIRATGVADGATHTMKYKVISSTGTFKYRRIVAYTIS